MSHLITMSPGYIPPLCAEIDRVTRLAEVRRQMLVVWMEEGPTSYRLQELYDEEDRLTRDDPTR